jgi:2-octaprenylphenol hydroxylase
MMKRFDIVIAGGGMVGLTIAALLPDSTVGEQLTLHIFDAGKRPHYDPDGDVGLRVSAISPGSAHILSDAGCWHTIAGARVCPYQSMRVWDEGGSADGPEALRFDASEFAVPQLGFIVENQLIQTALISRLESRGVEIRFDTAIVDVTATGQGYRIDLDGGESIDADLLIGADGGSSFVRRKAEIALQAWQYSQWAFVTHLNCELGHRDTAWQRFLATGPIALLPLHDGRVSTVWSTDEQQARQAMEMDDASLSETISAAAGHVLGTLTPAGPRGMFPLKAQHAEQYVLRGLALAGDAAHCVHPLAGQGVNLGLADAAALAATIADAVNAREHPGDLPHLRRYERARKGANSTMLHFIDGINRLFSFESAPAARIRGGGMRLFNASGVIRQRAVSVALGLS